QTPQAVAKMLEHLRVKKIRLVLDGFGSGLSSLSMLRDMPIDSIKLDRSLLANPESNENYVRAITCLAHELGVNVIAYGVDNEELMTQLRGLNIDYAQGDFISPPVDAATVTNMLR
ncbi:MAG: EAL domain-containing protein, partial [Gammaproteobacteria bacterium]